MKLYLVAWFLMASAAMAQTAPATPPAAWSSNQKDGTADSFTMREAKSRLEEKGFTDVLNLRKDDSGVWHGTAQKNGTSEQVWVDYKGNSGVSK